MCQFVGTFYDECGHVRFDLHTFCDALYNQLQRINDPVQREQYSLPFDPNTPGCDPYCLFTWHGHPAVPSPPGSGNVLWWVFNLMEPCAECARICKLWGL